MFGKLIGLFGKKFKSVPDTEFKPSGYILNNQIIPLEHPENHIIIEIDEDYSFSILYTTFSLLYGYLAKYDITFLILLKDKKYFNNVNEILSLLYIKNFIFIDDYNFEKEDMQVIYLNQPILYNKKNILYYNINFMRINNLEIDLLTLFLNSNVIPSELNIIKFLTSLHQVAPNLEHANVYNLAESSYVDIFKLNYLLQKYPNQYNIVITTNDFIYRQVFPQNTIYINLDNLLNNKSKFYYDLVKFILLTYSASCILNTDHIITFLSAKLKYLLHKQLLYKLIYSNETDPHLLAFANNLGFIREYTVNENNINQALKIAFFTRVTRLDNLDRMYDNIKAICKANNALYLWFLIIPANKVCLDLIPSIMKNDQSVIIIDQFISFNEYDRYDSELMNLALMHKSLINCQFLYVLDDDNLLHPNFINTIRKNIDKYLIINRLELTDVQKGHHVTQNIECPINLTSENCIGHVDFANVIFNINALHYVHGFNLEKGSGVSDGATVKAFLDAGIQLTYSNEYGGYYNRCQ